MRIEIPAGRLPMFASRMADLAPWMHPYKFADDIYCGFYKYAGLGDLTWVNGASDPAKIAAMRAAYESRDHRIYEGFFTELIRQLRDWGADPAQMSFLDVAAATGKNSFLAARNGFGQVTATEIRQNQCEQISLITSSTSDETLRAVQVIHDPVSADAPEYPDRYGAESYDVVASFGLLYHLENPVQHIVNLRRITRRFAVVYTMTHQDFRALDYWRLTMEEKEWITKATSGISWTGHYLTVARMIQEAGFRRVIIHYPEIFRRNAPNFRDERKMGRELRVAGLIKRLTGMTTGPLKNQMPDYFRHAGVNPNYFAFVCEK